MQGTLHKGLLPYITILQDGIGDGVQIIVQINNPSYFFSISIITSGFVAVFARITIQPYPADSESLGKT